MGFDKHVGRKNLMTIISKSSPINVWLGHQETNMVSNKDRVAEKILFEMLIV